MGATVKRFWIQSTTLAICILNLPREFRRALFHQIDRHGIMKIQDFDQLWFNSVKAKLVVCYSNLFWASGSTIAIIMALLLFELSTVAAVSASFRISLMNCVQFERFNGNLIDFLSWRIFVGVTLQLWRKWLLRHGMKPPKRSMEFRLNSVVANTIFRGFSRCYLVFLEGLAHLVNAERGFSWPLATGNPDNIWICWPVERQE